MAQHGPDDHDDDDDNHDDNHHHHHHHVGFTTGHYCLACTNWNNLRCGRPPHAERGEYIKMNHPVIITTQTPPKKKHAFYRESILRLPSYHPNTSKNNKCILQRQCYMMLLPKKHPKTAIILIHSQPFLPNARRHIFFQWPSLPSDLVFKRS